ncbi:MAG: V-type ATP synthase subunit K [Kiritimatiellaeota bacterium]|nr:V-type ATP synthase subunit K [Kiritimatiellota bacterium]
MDADAVTTVTTTMSQAWGMAGAVICLGLSAVGSILALGTAASAAIGAWKKCYLQNKQAPFLLMALVGVPMTQTLYGMIVMFTMFPVTALGFPLIVIGTFAGLAIGLSAVLQGKAAAAAIDAQAETGQGFTNYLIVLGIIETVGILTMVFSLIVLMNMKV